MFRPDDSWRWEKPLLAVVSFDDRASSPLGWDLGGGVARILEDRLYATGRFRVLDRGDIGDVLDEQAFQSAGLTREEQAVPARRLKNAHYLVRGEITDFTHADLSGLDVGIGPLRIGAGGEHAVVSIAIKVTDVESGELVYSSVVEGKVYAGGVDFGAVYEHVALGGQQFSRTPLGRALRDALDEAIDGIEERVGRRAWRPSIAAIDGGVITLSGGADRHLEVGDRWIVRAPGPAIIDPTTGDTLGHAPGAEIGVLRVSRVEDRLSLAEVESGAGFDRGQRLERASPSPR